MRGIAGVDPDHVQLIRPRERDSDNVRVSCISEAIPWATLLTEVSLVSMRY